mmetsp:Transcript_8691/g.15651  ORF Transcript_8691/g.15651 Transcript_8691/m.15651 type:complete len:194 (-) Transcript_8691:218-799(-)
MSLLVEPANKSACQRNEKEQRLREGSFIQWSQEDYIMAHLGFAVDPQPASVEVEKAKQRSASLASGASLRAAAELASVPPRSQASTPKGSAKALSEKGSVAGSSRKSSVGGASASKVNAPGSRRMGSSRSASSLYSEGGRKLPPRGSPEWRWQEHSALKKAVVKDMVDPVQAVMMKGPPLFSPSLCTRAAPYF